MVWLILSCILLANAEFRDADYVVLADAGENGAYLPAADRLAKARHGVLREFDPLKLDEAFGFLAEQKPRYVVFVARPDVIDVDWTHDILKRSTQLDADPFCDFEYGFVTGRDGPAAMRFVDRIIAARDRNYGRKATLFGSWEGFFVPQSSALTSLAAMKAEGDFHFISARAKEATRAKAARAGLEKCVGRDVLMFFSHGYPDRMDLCFRGVDLVSWKTDLAPAILVNCACFNGAPGRSFAPGKDGPVAVPAPSREESVCLAILDSGVAGYFSGVDPWHGPLAMQVFGHVFDSGMRLGEAAKRMHDRLALDFLPERIDFAPVLQVKNRFGGEGTINRRHNGSGMILYGDPSFAPFADNASRLEYAEMKATGIKTFEFRLGVKSQIAGPPAEDAMIPNARLLDYYSIKTNDFAKELKLELHRVAPLPAGITGAPTLRVLSVKSKNMEVPFGTPQGVIESTPDGLRLHLRVPLDIRGIDNFRVSAIASQGVEAVVEAAW